VKVFIVDISVDGLAVVLC